MTEKLQWWGYLHTAGTLQVKRVFDDVDVALYIQDAHESPFVKEVFEPFYADTRQEALKHCEFLLNSLMS